MNAANLQNTLLALLLALKKLETPLSDTEQSALSQAAEQLYANPNAWDLLIEPPLLAMIQANESLNQLYKIAKSQLDALRDEIPSHLLPTQAEFEAVIPTNQSPVKRGKLPVNDGYKSNEINNVAINILSTANPVETAKKLSRIEQLQQFLQQSISGK